MAHCVWLVLALLMPLAAPVHAVERDYYFERIDSRNGLAQNTVSLIFQDRRGYMWLVTEGGLHRYDGYRLTHYRHDSARADSLPSNSVVAMADAAQGRLWLTDLGGSLVLFDPDRGRSLPLPAALKRQLGHVTALSGSRDGALFIGSANGVHVLDPRSRAPRTLWTAPQPGDVVRQFSTCADGRRYALAGAMLLQVGKDAQHTRVLARDIHNAATLQCLDDGRVLLAGARGVSAVDPQSGATRTLWPRADDAPPASTNVRAIAQDHAGRLWLAINGIGLLQLDGQGHTRRILQPQHDVSGSLPDASINTLYVDRSGLLWSGGVTRGAAYMDPAGSPFRYLFGAAEHGDIAAGNNVRAIAEAANGTLWIGLTRNGLRSYDPVTRQFTDYTHAFAGSAGVGPGNPLRVSAIAASGDGYHIASSRGLFQFDPQTGRARRLYPAATEAPRAVRALLHARDGSWWLAVVGEGVLHMRDAQVVHRYTGVPGNLAFSLVTSLAEDAAGNVWAGSFGGLSRIAPDGSVRTFHEASGHPDSLSNDVVTTLFVDADGVLWAGTQSGLDRLLRVDADAAHFRRYTTDDGLPDATIYCIRGDASQHLWLSTNLGIARLDPASGKMQTFTLRDGLQGLEYNANACARAHDGSLLFGGVNGLDQVQPASIKDNRFSPPMVITAATVGTGRIDSPPPADGLLVMAPPNRIVRLAFAAMDFAAPQQNRFQYRLRGFDRDWVDADTRHTVTYTNLDAGNYRFEVRGSNHQGNFGSRVATLNLRVLPPWWNSWWAHALYALLAALVVLLCLLLLRARRAGARQHQHQLRVREDRLSMALWGSGDAFWDLDLRSNRLYRPGTSEQGAGFSREMNLDDWRNHIVHPDDLARVQEALDQHIAGRTDYIEQELRVRDSGGAWTWILARGKIAEHDSDGHPLRICGTARDIGKRLRAEADRRIAAEVVRSMGEAVTVTDLDFNFRSVNPAFTRMTGYDEQEIFGTNAAVLNSLEHDGESYGRLREQAVKLGHWRGETWQRRKDGSDFLSWVEISEVCDSSGQRTHYVAVLTDITDRKQAEQELRYLANYDMLTGLPNRTLLSERLGHAIAKSSRSGQQLAVLYVDLDRFKHVNDSMGHATGDQLLKAAGARLRQCVRDQDTVARVGGDEFTLVVQDIDGEAEAEAAAARIIRAFATPLFLETRQEVLISPSVGIALHPRHGHSADDLLKYADTAMYQAKERGRNVWALYTEDMDTSARLRASMSGSLRRALERDELDVVYQPKLDIITQHIFGVEALLRWHSGDLGQVPPAIFVPLAEESGLIVDLGEFVLRRACADLAQWRRQGLTSLSMAVNLSMAQLQRSELPRTLRGILAEHGIPAGRLELELTESMVMGNVEHSVHVLGQLKAIGITLAIDDFGTGYSSLAYLKRLPIDTLKIDRAFVGDVTVDPEDATITSTIITMAHSLGMDVVAEGVETGEQLAFLRAHGCDSIQGNWFSPPLSAADCRQFCDAHVNLPVNG